jgi:quercetin dioxygenase-like cupin family protein
MRISLQMRLCLVIVAFGVMSATAAQQPATVDPSAVTKQVLKNDDVEVGVAEIPAHTTVNLHRHERDYLTVFLSDGQLTNTIEGSVGPKPVTFRRGDVRMIDGGFAHTVTNEGAAPIRLLHVDFAEKQGRQTPGPKASRYCNPHSKTACVEEKYLFCTEKICVSDVTMGPGAVTYRHRHSTDHMVIPLSDFDMRDEVTGAEAVIRKQKVGDVIYIPAGISHRLVNGPATCRFIVISWK